jgi:hypothetical protein
MKKTNLLLIFIVVLIILFLGYHAKIIYDYGIAVKQEVVLRKERQLRIATNMEFKGTILQKTLSNHQFDGYYVKIDFFYLDLGDDRLHCSASFPNEWYRFDDLSSSVVWRVSKEEYDSLVVGDSIFKEKGSLIIKRLN